MQVHELNELLSSNPHASLQFVLPSGELVPAHFHVTEVGRIHKSFIDCGGTMRESVACQLQLWTADDVEHRLRAGKLAQIMGLAAPVLQSADLPVEVEYGGTIASLYSISHFVSALGSLQIFLQGKQTDCLAREKCGVPGAAGASACC